MTLYYDEEEDALAENHPDEWVEYDDGERLLFDLSDQQKRRGLKMVAEKAIEVHEPTVDVGEMVLYVDVNGVQHGAIVKGVSPDNYVTLVYADGVGELELAWHVPEREEEGETEVWFRD